MTNWGKVSTSGRYEVKSFADAVECEERAQQLVDAKLKAGFQDFPGFDPMQSFYYDDDEMGLHPLTSHPTFRKYFGSEVYYSSIQDAAPFGNDEGSDALWELSDLLRRRPKADLTHYPASLISKLYHLPFCPPKGETYEELEAQRNLGAAPPHGSCHSGAGSCAGEDYGETLEDTLCFGTALSRSPRQAQESRSSCPLLSRTPPAGA